MSLNGKIADTDGNVDWLESIPNPGKTDYRYAEMYNSIDTTIQGYKTYKQILDWGIEFPYKGKKNFVLTRQIGLENTDQVEFLSQDPISFLKELKNKSGKNIWLIGGGNVNTLLLNENLIDEIQVFVMPIILSEGIELFESIPNRTYLELIHTKSYSSGVTEMIYKVNKA
jgi:dihydrofolate reductase